MENERSTRTHDLKSWPAPFADLVAGRRQYELRINDRGYRAGDRITFREWDPRRGYTGAFVLAMIAHVSTAESYAGILDGMLGAGVAVLGLVVTGGGNTGATVDAGGV